MIAWWFLSSMTVSEVNQAFKRIIAPQSRLLLVTQPVEKVKPAMPVETLASLWNDAMKQPQPEWMFENNHAVLPVIEPKAGTVKREKVWVQHKLTEYRLSNGSKLVYRYSDSNPGQVHFKALTSGGVRSVPASDYHLLRTAVSLVDDTGIGPVSQSDIQTIFRGNPVVMSTILDEYQQGFSGWAKTDSFEKMLQLFHMKLESSPVSEKVLKQHQTESLQYSSSGLDSADRFVRQVSSLRYPNTPTVYSESSEELAALTTEQLSRAYQRYIASKTDYTYFVVGDISPAEIERLAARYLASVAARPETRETYKVEALSPSKRLTVSDSKEPRAEVDKIVKEQHRVQRSIVRLA